MNGHWQREIPKKAGRYWTATIYKRLAAIEVVVYENDGNLYYAGGYPIGHKFENCWLGWWWSEPIETPPLPTEEF